MGIPVGGFAAAQLAAMRQGRVMTRRPEIMEHYRHLRRLSIESHTGALKFAARSTLLEQAKRLVSQQATR